MFARRADDSPDPLAASTPIPSEALVSPAPPARASIGPAQRQLAIGVTWLLLGGLVAVLVAGVVWSGDSVGWLLVIAIAAIGGLVGGVLRSIRMPLLAVLVNFPLALGLGVVSVRQPYWVIDVLAASAPVGLAFIAGMTLPSRRVNDTSPAWEARLGHLRPLIVVGVACLSLAPLAYGTVGAVVANGWAEPDQDCRTPTHVFGWSYEAINYDIAVDEQLRPSTVKDERGQDKQQCAGPAIPRAIGATHGDPAGDQVITEDGVAIAGWYIPAASGIGPSGPTIIVVPGAKANKSGMLKYTPALHERYNVVVFDNRGMGQSGPGEFAMGALEQRDVRAVVDWLERTKHPAWIASLGNSLGAATALAEAERDPRIRAVVLDSMHGRAVSTTGNIIESEKGLPGIAASWAIVLVTELRLHADVPDADPVHTVSKLGDRPVLLIHGTKDVIDLPEQSADANYASAHDAGVPVDLRYCANARHGVLVDDARCKDDWVTWVTAFLDNARARDT